MFYRIHTATRDGANPKVETATTSAQAYEIVNSNLSQCRTGVVVSYDSESDDVANGYNRITF